MQRLALHNDQWVDASELSVSIHDAGFTQSATIVERIRAYNGKLFALSDHLDRWKHSATSLALHEFQDLKLIDLKFIEDRLHELLERNRHWVRDQVDFGALLVGTAGMDARPTLVLDLYPIDHNRVAEHIESGSSLWITDVEQPPAACWPRSIKVRSRLHYYLADRQAHQQHDGSLGVLLDQDGTVTETGIANVLLVEGESLVSPPLHQILPGVSLGIVRRLSRQCGIEFIESRILPSRLLAADEVLLTGTRCGVWFANSVNERRFTAGKVYRRLRAAFDQLICGKIEL
ncbi:MAG: aminotransferase class IV [Planctomycetota bacterium]